MGYYFKGTIGLLKHLYYKIKRYVKNRSAK